MLIIRKCKQEWVVKNSFTLIEAHVMLLEIRFCFNLVTDRPYGAIP
jgi:hypothetical protein